MPNIFQKPPDLLLRRFFAFLVIAFSFIGGVLNQAPAASMSEDHLSVQYRITAPHVGDVLKSLPADLEAFFENNGEGLQLGDLQFDPNPDYNHNQRIVAWYLTIQRRAVDVIEPLLDQWGFHVQRMGPLTRDWRLNSPSVIARFMEGNLILGAAAKGLLGARTTREFRHAFDSFKQKFQQYEASFVVKVRNQRVFENEIPNATAWNFLILEKTALNRFYYETTQLEPHRLRQKFRSAIEEALEYSFSSEASAPPTEPTMIERLLEPLRGPVAQSRESLIRRARFDTIYRILRPWITTLRSDGYYHNETIELYDWGLRHAITALEQTTNAQGAPLAQAREIAHVLNHQLVNLHWVRRPGPLGNRGFATYEKLARLPGLSPYLRLLAKAKLARRLFVVPTTEDLQSYRELPATLGMSCDNEISRRWRQVVLEGEVFVPSEPRIDHQALQPVSPMPGLFWIDRWLEPHGVEPYDWSQPCGLTVELLRERANQFCTSLFDQAH